MRGEPHGAGLLEDAARALADAVAPALSGDARLAALMAASAARMVAREVALAATLAATAARLEEVGGASLVADLRAGSLDAERAVYDALLAATAAATAVTRPSAVTGEERRAAGLPPP